MLGGGQRWAVVRKGFMDGAALMGPVKMQESTGRGQGKRAVRENTEKV